VLKVTREEFETQASRAGIHHLIRRTVGVINQIRVPAGPKRDSEVSGTGSIVAWNGQRVVLTAKHVLDNVTSPADLRIAAFHDAKVTFKERVNVTKEDSDAGIVLGPDSNIHLCGWEDIAVVTIPGPAFDGSEPVDIENEWADPPENEIVIGTGFPTDNHVEIDQTQIGNRTEIGIGLIPITFHGPILPLPTDYDLKFHITDHDSARHYLVPYESTSSTHPAGVSGAAIWWEPESKEVPVVWTPHLHFAGMCLAVYMKGYSHRRGPVIQVIKASVVRRFLEETFGP
jgi:hypothetical protein